VPLGDSTLSEPQPGFVKWEFVNAKGRERRSSSSVAVGELDQVWGG